MKKITRLKIRNFIILILILIFLIGGSLTAILSLL